MRFMVFQSANRGATNSSAAAMIRMLGLYENAADADEAITLHGGGLETRMWPTANGETPTWIPQWRPITMLNLVDTKDPQAALQAEYASVEGRLQAWTAMREQECVDVAEAAEKRIMRPIDELVALNALEIAKEASVESTGAAQANEERVSAQGVNATGTANTSTERIKARPLSRAAELRGQVWALVGIIGDAAAETRRRTIRKDLGARLAAAAAANAEADINATPIDSPVAADVAEAQAALDGIVDEPMVTFLETSDDPEVLEKKAAEAAQQEAFKHVDLAVVRLYEWILLSHVRESKAATRVSRKKALPEAWSMGGPST